MGLYEPAIERMRVEEIRAKRKAVRQEKARVRQEKREKYKALYREELAKERAKLKAQRELDIEQYKTRRAIEKAHARARARVKPFTPSTIFKIHPKRLTPEQKRKLKKAGVEIGKTTVKLGKKGLKILDAMYGTGRKPTKRKSYKRKSTKRKTYKRKKVKQKSYYCYKCKKRHSYISKIGRKHKR